MGGGWWMVGGGVGGVEIALTAAFTKNRARVFELFSLFEWFGFRFSARLGDASAVLCCVYEAVNVLLFMLFILFILRLGGRG